MTAIYRNGDKAMNKIILALILIFGSYPVFAQALPVANVTVPVASFGTSLLANNEILGEKGVELFTALINKSKTYALLATLESSTPQLNSQLKYLALLIETHQINQTLSQLQVALRNNNRLLAKFIHKAGGAMDG